MNDVRRAVVTVLVSFPVTLVATFALAAAVVALLHPSAPTSLARVDVDGPRADAGRIRFEAAAIGPDAQFRQPAVDVLDMGAVQSALRASMTEASDVELHATFPAHGHVFVIEPLETQLGPEWFMSAPPSRVLMTGERLTLWPIYGSIVPAPK